MVEVFSNEVGGKRHAVSLHCYVTARLLRYCAASDAILLPPPGSKLVGINTRAYCPLSAGGERWSSGMVSSVP
ncbi:hypothetical protein CesoFtcFv8_017871 [Champsocephalus esox]|uniref:Uncharacterized protein n=1 Tax=Champsocephalus esox TaxID=159716 RepID=A0AAN8GR58_9TELE|nr:hypothetical protein CesoFtcFv8_017871 [Champsocephalus esox]